MTTIEASAEIAGSLFDDELTPVLRRLGQRDSGAGDAAAAEDDTAVRAGVWAALAELGALRPVADPEGTVALVETCERMGAALYQSPYAGTVTAADLLGHGPLTAGIAAGDVTLSMAWHENGTADPATPGPLRIDEAAGTISGQRRFVPFASEVDFLLVVGLAGGRLFSGLVPVDQPGVVVRRQDDVGRGDLYSVTFDHALVMPDGLAEVGERYPAVLAAARVRHAAYLAGLSRGALELTVARLKERDAFGQPLARFQALAYRMAALTARTAAVLSLARATAPDPGELAATQVLLLATELARECAAEAVHLHGAYGMTERCDASLFYRRAAVDTLLLGTPAQLRRHAGALLTAHSLAARNDSGGSEGTP